MKQVIATLLLMLLLSAAVAVDTPRSGTPISAAEYFIDVDPGFGNGQAIPITGGWNVSMDFSVSTTGLRNGTHRLYVRTQNSDGTWGIPQSKMFIVQDKTQADPTPTITQAEYFIDSISGTPVHTALISSGITASLDVSIPTTGLRNGTHRLYVRTQNSDGTWGIPQSKMFIVQDRAPNEAAPNIVAVKWFLDQNSSTAVTQAVSSPSTNITEVLDIPLEGLSMGTHNVRIQAMNADNVWGIPQSLNFDFVPINNPPVIDMPPSIAINQNESVQINMASYVSDADNDQLYISVPNHDNINVAVNGLVVTLCPRPNWTGTEQLTFVVNDYNYTPTRDAASDVVTVNVTNPLLVDFETDSQFNNNVVAGAPQTTIGFSATSNLPLTSFTWDFNNDGSTDSILPNPSYTYPDSGLVSVKLTASDGVHVTTVIKQDYIHVHPGVVVPPAVVNQNIVWTEQGGPYNLIGEVLLNSGYSLTIEPNAQVNMLVDNNLVINGSINATEANFTAYGENGWGGIVLGSTATNSVINGINVVGAATGITINDCNPVLTGITLVAAEAQRTPTQAIVINGASAPLISNLNINNFAYGIKANNPGTTPVNLNINSLRINRGTSTPASGDTAFEINGNYIVDISSTVVTEYPFSIKIDSTNRSRARARLTNTRMIKTESNNRDNSVALSLSNLSHVEIVRDSLIGFNTGIFISNPGSPCNITMQNCSIRRELSQLGSEVGIKLLGSSSGTIDSTFVYNYNRAMDLNGNHALQITSNKLLDCAMVLSEAQNHATHSLQGNVAYRSDLFSGVASLPAFSLDGCTSVTVKNSTLHAYQNYLHATNASAMNLTQNILWSASPQSNPITLLGGSVLNATYNDIALLQSVQPGIGNINSNPMFLNPALDNFALNVYSPCIDAGNPTSPHDPDGSIVDMGAIPFNWATAPLIADFYVDTSSGQHPLTVHFTDHSTRNTISREWDFNNDGNTDSTGMNPTWTYNNTGNYSVKLRVFDGQRYDIKLVPDLIQVLNTPPQISQVIPPQTIMEDSQAVSLDLANYFHDPNGDPISYSFSQSTQVVTAALNGSILTISTNQNVSGTCQITINAVETSSSKSSQSSKISDSSLHNSDRDQSRTSQSFTVTVTPVNDAPTITIPASYTFAEDGNLVVNMASLVSDVDSANLTISVVNSQHVFAAINGLVATLTSSANWSGTESLSFTVSDGLLSANASTNIVVTPVNDAPVITSFLPNQGELTLVPGTSQQFDIIANDIDSNISYEWWLNGSLQQGDSSSFTYLFSVVGTHQLVSKVTDGFAVAEHSWSIQVPYINNPPQITQAISNLVIAEDFAPIEMDLSDYFHDPEGDPISYSFTQSTQVVTAALNGSILTISCLPDISGTCEISVSAMELPPNLSSATKKQDQAGTNNRDAIRISQSFVVTVESVNDAPSISLLPSYQFAEDEALTLDIADCIHDVDSSNLSLSVSGNQLIHCTIEGSTLHFTAEPNWFGSEQITVTVSDNRRRLSSSTNTMILVSPVNDAPQIVSYTPATTNIEAQANSTVNFSIEATDIDSQLSYRWYVNGEQLAEGSASYSYLFSISGSYSVSVTVADEVVELTNNWEVLVPVGVDDPELIPQCTSLSPVFPNPFRGQTRISYSLKEAGYISLNVYNTKGQLIRNLCSLTQSAASYQISWDGRDNSGMEVASGVYFIRMIASGETHMVKALLIK